MLIDISTEESVKLLIVTEKLIIPAFDKEDPDLLIFERIKNKIEKHLRSIPTKEMLDIINGDINFNNK